MTPFGLTAAAATDAAIHKKMIGSRYHNPRAFSLGRPSDLAQQTKEMKDIKILLSLEDPRKILNTNT